jgi:glutamine amidotransferase
MIEIIDLGINNLNSVLRAIRKSSEIDLEIVSKPKESFHQSIIILPGLGNFGTGSAILKSTKLDAYLKRKVESGSRLIGICLGMQLLGCSSEESPNLSGLELIPGKVRKLPKFIGERVPNIGWAETEQSKNFEEFPSLSKQKDFYFVHSYFFEPSDQKDILALTQFGDMKFASAIKLNNVLGFQFHPEKSAEVGKSLLLDCLKWATNET